MNLIEWVFCILRSGTSSCGVLKVQEGSVLKDQEASRSCVIHIL